VIGNGDTRISGRSVATSTQPIGSLASIYTIHAYIPKRRIERVAGLGLPRAEVTFGGTY
jgi:hypothetical protein